MVKKFADFLREDLSCNGFSLTPADASQTAKNINTIFVMRAKWFRFPEPIHIEALTKAYKELCPDMEKKFPGVVDMMLQPAMVKKLGFSVDENGFVHWQK